MSNVTTDITVSALCDSIVQSEYNIVVAGICATLALFGLVYTYFGYRCFKAVMFLSGLIFGGTTVYLICQEERIFQQIVSLEIAAGIAVGIGILSGLITMLVRYIGLFLQGFFLGVLVAFAAILALQSVYHPSTAWIPVGILFGTGIIFSLLTLKYQKQLIIVSTAVFGSVLITASVDYFLEDFLLMRYAWEALMANPSFSVCWYTWVILSIWPTLSLAGILVQWKFTSKGYDHTDVIIPRGRRKHVRTHLVRPHRTPQTHSNPRSSVAAPVPARPAASSVASRRPQQRVSDNHQRMTAVDQRQMRVDVLEEGEPPSYFECVELGVGEPVRRSSYQAPARPNLCRLSQPRSSRHDDMVQQITHGQGYVGLDQEPSRGYVAAAEARVRSQHRSVNPSPNREPVGQFSRQDRPKPSQGRNRPDPSRRARPSGRRYRVSPAASDGASGNQSDRSDTERLLADPPRALSNREAIAVHAQRLLAVQNRRFSGVHSNRDSSPLSHS